MYQPTLVLYAENLVSQTLFFMPPPRSLSTPIVRQVPCRA